MSPVDAREKVVRAILDDHLDEALATIGKFGLSDACAFETAYILNRQNKTSEAMKVIGALPALRAQEFKVLHLKAQLLHKEEKFEEAFEIYNNLCTTVANIDEECELLCNTIACAVQSENSIQILRSLELAKNAISSNYDVSFNAATCSIQEGGQLSKAYRLLNGSLNICNHVADRDEWGDSQRQNEVARIRVQQAYVEYEAGRIAKARCILDEVCNQLSAPPQALAVASNNLAVLNGGKDVFDSQKRLRAVAHKQVDAKLNQRQRMIAKYNSLLLQVVSQVPLQQFIDSSQGFQQDHPNSHLPSLLRAYAYFRHNKFSQAESELRSHMEVAGAGPTASRAGLALAHLQIDTGNNRDAVSTLLSLADSHKHQGILATVTKLFELLNNAEGALPILEEAVSKLEREPVQGDLVFDILVNVGKFQARLGKHQEAVATLQKALSVKPGSLAVLSYCAISQSKFDADSAIKTVDAIPSAIDDILLKSLIADRAALESLQTPKLRISLKRQADESGVVEDEGIEERDVQKKKKRKKNKTKPAKVMDGHPDPERWKQLKDRSYYRKDFNKRRAAKKNKNQSSGNPAALAR